jgi:hypothetical protein
LTQQPIAQSEEPVPALARSLANLEAVIGQRYRACELYILKFGRLGYSMTSSAQSKQRLRHGEAQRLRGLQIDGKPVMGRLFDRQIAGCGALKNLRDLMRHATPQLAAVGDVGDLTIQARSRESVEPCYDHDIALIDDAEQPRQLWAIGAGTGLLLGEDLRASRGARFLL